MWPATLTRPPATGYASTAPTPSWGGTSAVAPLWAALLTLAVQQKHRPLGAVNQELYSRFGTLPGLSGGFRDIVSGTNGAYQAGPGWDACTGLGSPRGAALLQALAAP